MHDVLEPRRDSAEHGDEIGLFDGNELLLRFGWHRIRSWAPKAPKAPKAPN